MSFKNNVKKVVKNIPPGKVLTYKKVAKKAGRKKAYQAVGNILADNTNSNIPCHRVIKSDKTLGQYNQGVLKKAHLLYTEGYDFPNKKILKQDFFNRNTKKVAKDLIGKWLVKDEKALIITEVEIYAGKNDLASHASCGKTKRTRPMFGKAGIWYIYLIYGMYYMLNIVTREKGFPAAILIRGSYRISGPGKITNHLGVDKSFNNKPAKKSTGLWLEDRGIKVAFKKIKALKRIGVDYAKDWKDKLFRFKYLNNN